MDESRTSGDEATAADGATAADEAAEMTTCYCPLGGVFDRLSRRYAMQVICVVGAIGPARYGEIEAAFGTASSSTLSSRLEELVDAGYLSREQYAEIPPRVEYDLTPDGEELCQRLQPLLEWAAAREESTPGESNL